MVKRWKIAIIGGTGGMGQILARDLKPFGDIIIISRSLEKATQISEELGVHGGVLNDCKTADIIIISVPFDNILETCQNVFKIAKSGSLIIDISAIKSVLEQISPEIPPHLSYISMHPLFGPEGAFSGNNVLLVPVKGDNWLPLLQKLLRDLKATTTIVTAEEHDLIMSKIQVAHHFMYLILVGYLSQDQIPPNFYTRSFRKTLQNFQAIEKNLNVILEIQKHNPHAEEIRNEIVAFMEQFISLDQESKIQDLLQRIDAFKNTFLSKNED